MRLGRLKLDVCPLILRDCLRICMKRLVRNCMETQDAGKPHKPVGVLGI